MLQKTFIAMATTFTLATMSIGAAHAMDQHRHHYRHHNGVNIGIGLGGFGYNRYQPDYYENGFYDSPDCGWQWINVKRWNDSHTRFTVRHRKVWSCN